MLNALHSYYKPLCLALLVLLGLACGHLAGSVLQVTLRPELSTATKPVSLTSVPRQGFVESDLDQILRQNIFDVSQRSATAHMDAAQTTDVGAQNSGTEVPATIRSDLKLIGTVVAGEHSLALLENGQAIEIFRLGEELPGGGVLETIQRSQVEIRLSNEEIVTLLLHEPESSGARSTPTASVGQSGADTEDNLRGTIREVGANRWVVSEDLVQSVRDNFAAQLRLAQMQPVVVEGDTRGFFVRRINPRSVLAQMGLQRGDIVVDVNDIKLDSPEKALQIFQQLREARQISVAIIRQGQPLTFQYEIQ